MFYPMFKSRMNNYFTNLNEPQRSKYKNIHKLIEKELDQFHALSGTDTHNVNDHLLRFSYNSKNKDHIDYIKQITILTDNETNPCIKNRANNIAQHMLKTAKGQNFTGDKLSAVKDTIRTLEEYKGNEIKLRMTLLKKEIASSTKSDEYKKSVNLCCDFIINNMKGVLLDTTPQIKLRNTNERVPA